MELHRIKKDGTKVFKHYNIIPIDTNNGRKTILQAAFDNYMFMLNCEELKKNNPEVWKENVEYYKRDYKERVCEYWRVISWYEF